MVYMHAWLGSRSPLAFMSFLSQPPAGYKPRQRSGLHRLHRDKGDRVPCMEPSDIVLIHAIQPRQLISSGDWVQLMQ